MSRARAMTLIEVVASLAILVVLSAGVIGFFVNITGRRDELARLASQQREVALVFDRIEAALVSAVAVAPDGTAGIRGDERSITIVTRSVNAALDGPASVADAASLAFEFDERGARCSCALTALAGGGAPVSEPIADHVERMRLRYLIGRSWESSFDSIEAGGLPVAIEVSVWFEPRTGPLATPSEEAGANQHEGDPGARQTEAEDTPPVPLERGPALDEMVWIPREPDHTRVIAVPDAAAGGSGGGGR
jgi:type II secretory pathway component PulJ